MPNISVNSIPTNARVYINGILDYSHIATLIDGEELAADNARKAAKGMIPCDKPHTRMVISHASVDYANPAEPSLAEQYIAERLYKSIAHPDKGDCYMAMNKTHNLPEIFRRDNIASKALDTVPTGNEIAVGSNVTLIVRFFATKANMNKGVSLDAVIVNEKTIRWVTGGMSGALAERGFVISDTTASVDDIREQLAENIAEIPVTQPAPTPVVVPATYAQPAPAVAPAPTPAVYVQPAVAPAPVTQPAPAPSLPIPPKGYVYDSNGRIVPAPAGGITL